MATRYLTTLKRTFARWLALAILGPRWVCWAISRHPATTALALSILIAGGADYGLIRAKAAELAGKGATRC